MLYMWYDEGQTPLHFAAMFNQPAILKALIERGTSRMIKDKSNNTAIDYSKQKVHVECLLLLLFTVVLHFLSPRNTKDFSSTQTRTTWKIN